MVRTSFLGLRVDHDRAGVGTRLEAISGHVGPGQPGPCGEFPMLAFEESVQVMVDLVPPEAFDFAVTVRSVSGCR